jgi:hypothetical protein
MPLAPYTPTLIELPISDLVAGDTVLKRKARFLSLLHRQEPDGTCTVFIDVLVMPYSKSGIDYGAAITNPGVVPYKATLTAANDTLVDAASGAILCTFPLGTPQSAKDAKIASFSQSTMYQGDFFCMLRDTQSVKIGGMIIQNIQQADAMGRFA